MENDALLTVVPENPFPGLRSFEMNESFLFFGREKHISDVLEKLFTHRFVAVVGSSGSGKSSLVRAGLLPLVYKGLDKFSGENWKIAVFRPGNSPIQNLVKVLASPSIFGSGSSEQVVKFEQEIFNLLNESPLGLVEAVRKYSIAKQPLFILIDQFEELFRFQDKEGSSEQKQMEAEQFVKLFTEAIQQRDVPVYVMLTIRADFLGDCARFEGLPEAINEGQYLVPQMNREQIKSVITKPVELAKGKISPRLVHQLLNDLKGKQDQLPILQHAMMRAWDKWKQSATDGHPIDIEHYEIIGTMSKALSQHADEVYSSLQTERQKVLAELIFKTLTIKGSDNRGIRRPTTLKKLCEITETNEAEITEVLDQFRSEGRTFITPALPADLTSETVIDISHESLMRIWERLEKWVDEEYQSSILYGRLSESAQLYEEGKAALWRDPELQFALDWKEKNKPNKAWSLQYNQAFDLSKRFLELSLRERKAEKAKEKKRRILTNSFITLFFVACTLLTMWAMQEKKSQALSAQEADLQRLKAEEKAKEAAQQTEVANKKTEEAQESKTVAEIKSAEADKARMLAMQQGQIANEKTVETEEALKKSEQERQNALQSKGLAEQATMKAESEKNQKEKLRLLKVAQNMAYKAVLKFEDNQLPALLALQAYQLNKESGGEEQDPDIYQAMHKSLLNLNSSNSHVIPVESEFSSFGFNENNQAIIAASADGSVVSLNLKNYQATPLKIRNIVNKGANSVQLSSNGQYLFAAFDIFNAVVWDLSGDPGSGTELRGLPGYIKAAAFDKSNKTLATAKKDGTIHIWDLKNLKEGFTQKIELNKKITSLVFLGSTTQLAIGSEDGILTVWNYATNEKNSYNCLNGILSLGYSKTPAGNEWLAAGQSNGEVEMYGIQNSKLILKKSFSDITVGIERICFNKSSDLMAVSCADKTVRIYSLDNLNVKPVVLKEQNSKARAIIFDNRDKLYAAFANFRIQFWEGRSNALADKICGQLKRKSMTEAEWQTYVPETPYRKTCGN